jgi:hypothetical protein
LNVCKPSTSTVEHVTICTRCRDVNVEAIDDHIAMIKEQNDHIAKLSAKIAEHELENEKFKFARSMLYNGRHPDIKDGIGFQQGSQSNVKLNAPKKLSNFVKDKAPMVQDREGYILYPANYPEHTIRKIHARKPHNISHHAFMYNNEASSSRHSTHIKMTKKKIPNASNEHNILFKTFDASYVLTNKSGKLVAKYVGGKHKSAKTCVWVPKVLVSNVKGLVKGLGKIAISPNHSISNVFLVHSLDYNLLSVSQLCKMGYNCLFTDIGVTVFRRSDDSITFKGVLDGQLYLVNFNDNQAKLDTCLISKTNMGWLWHRRLAHVGMKNLHKLLKGEHILGLPNVHFEKDRMCSACQAGKQVGVHHLHKNIMTTDRPLELLHMDLFGSIAYISIGESKYCLVIMDDYSRFTWVFFL